MELQIKASLAGIAFGIWPLLMSRSGVSGNFASLVFTIVIVFCVAPFAIGQISDFSKANWYMLVGAGAVSAIGLLSFKGMLTKATPKDLGTLFVLMIVVQVASPVIYHVVMNGGINFTKGLGLVLAVVAIVLLAR